MADLGYTSKLQIVIVPSGKTYTTPDNKTGLLIFREASNTIEVNGHEYKATSGNDLTQIIIALKNTGYLTQNNNGTLSANNPGTVADLLGTKIATSGEGKNTVSGWIESLQSSISNINANITNLQNATKTDGNSNFVVRDKSDSGTDFGNTTVIQTAINTAKDNAISAAATDASNKDIQVKSDLIGNGVDSTDAEETALDLGTGKTWAVEEANKKTLSHLKDLILNLQGQLNDLTGTNLDKVKKDIEDIQKELIDPANQTQTTALSTILDHLKTLYGGTTEQSFNVNGGTQTTLAGIIQALEIEIKARIASVDKASEETLIDVQTDANKAVTISSTQELTTAVSKALSALPKGDSSYIDAVDLAASVSASLKGNASNDTMNSPTIEGAKKYADSKSSDAQTAAINQAKTYADSVITWTVIDE